MIEFIGGGLQVGTVAYHVSRIPTRKRVQLFRWEGVSALAVAEFRDEKHAADFLDKNNATASPRTSAVG